MAALLADVKKCRDALAAGATPGLADLAASLWQSSRQGEGQPTLAVVATSLDDLQEKLDRGAGHPGEPGATGTHDRPARHLLRREAGNSAGKVAFLFPGQGSQYPDMLAQTAMAFPEVRAVLDRAERTLAADLDRPLGKFIYPPSPFTPEQEAANRKELQRTEVAQPAVGATSLGMFRLLTALGIEADFFAGHSYGEYVGARRRPGRWPRTTSFASRTAAGVSFAMPRRRSAGGMIAADASPQTIEPLLKGMAGAWIANHNSPNQTVLAGTEDGLKQAAEKLQSASIRAAAHPGGVWVPLAAHRRGEGAARGRTR